MVNRSNGVDIPPRILVAPRAPTALACLAGAVLLTQAPFWIAMKLYDVDRPLFNLDIMLALLVALVLRPVGGLALALAWGIEITRDVARTYHFVDTGEFVASARYLGTIEIARILSWKLLPAVVAIASCGVLALRLTARARPAIPMAALQFFSMCTLVGIDTLNGSNRFLGLGADRFHLAVNVAGSPGWNIYREQRAALRGASEPMKHWAHAPVHDALRAWKAANPQGSEMLVLVESMGLPRTPAVRDWLYSRLTTPQVTARWQAQRTVDPFYGSTTYGELRTLCGLRGHYSLLKSGDERDCLPRIFAAAGGPAIGLHGFKLSMFDRQAWWPRVGLQPLRFDAADDASLRTACNEAFPGICDTEVLARAGRLAERPNSFTYVVTLDTHLPLPVHDEPIDPELARRCEIEALPGVACQMVQRLGDLLDDTAGVLSRLHATPMVAVVGDHAPPFVQAVDRDAFDQGRVTALLLTPRDDTAR